MSPARSLTSILPEITRSTLVLSPRAFSRIGARLPNLLVGSWGVKIEQGLDVSAHDFLLFLTLQRGIEDLLNASLSRQRSETRQKSRAR